MKAAAVPVGQSWMWTLAFGHHEEDRTPTHATERRARRRSSRSSSHGGTRAASGELTARKP
jgi:hypothetical protein